MTDEINPNLDLLVAEEVANFLKVSTPQAYKLMKSGAIPTVKLGRSVRVRRIDLIKVINQNIMGLTQSN